MLLKAFYQQQPLSQMHLMFAYILSLCGKLLEIWRKQPHVEGTCKEFIVENQGAFVT